MTRVRVVGGAGDAPGSSVAALARRAAAGLVLALAASFVVPALPGGSGAALAQVLVSNIGQPEGTPIFLGSGENAQGFKTGTHAAGYSLSAIRVGLETTGFASNSVTVSASLYSSSTTDPATAVPNTSSASLGSLTINGGETGFYSFTAPENTTLEANTIYFVVVEQTASIGASTNVRRTNSEETSEDSGAAAGWSITDRRLSLSSVFGTWGPSTRLMMIEVQGSEVTTTSTDATLSGLSLSAGTLMPAFASATTSYTASVENSVLQVTVTPTTTDANATVAYLDASDAALSDADAAAGHQAALAVGANTIKVEVTAEDGTTTRTYTIVVTREAATCPSLAAVGPNLDGSETIWSACLTVEEDPHIAPGGFGFYFITAGSGVNAGALTSTSFSYGSRTFGITYFGTEPTSSSCTGTAFNIFSLTNPNWNHAESSWVLHLGSHTLDFGDAILESQGDNVDWCGVTDTDLGWSDGSVVAVKIVRRNEPGAPTNVTATAASTAQIDLSWDAPSKTGGSAITGYRIEVSSDGGTSWTDLVADTASTDTAYEHTGLTAGAARRYRVSAINAIGTGDASASDDATTESAATSDITTPTANEDGSDTLWTTTLTVASFVSSSRQAYGYDTIQSVGSLASNSFTIGGTTYAVDRLAYDTGSPPRLYFWDITGSGFPAEQSDWVLNLGGTAFRGSDELEKSSLQFMGMGQPRPELGGER